MLMLVKVPVKTIFASFVPSPVVNVRPVSVDNVIVPLVTDKVTLAEDDAISTSVKEMPVMARDVSSFTDCAPGTVKIGASLTGLTLMAIVLAFVKAPPAPVLP